MKQTWWIAACAMLLATAVSATAQGSPEPAIATESGLKAWVATDFDAFARLVVGSACGSYVLNSDALAEIFPSLNTQGIRGISCENHCACGACVVINGQVACTACYACCAKDTACNSKCQSRFDGPLTSECSCTPPPPPALRVLDGEP